MALMPSSARSFSRLVPGCVFVMHGWPWIVTDVKDVTPEGHQGQQQFRVYLRTVHTHGDTEYTGTTQDYIFSDDSPWQEATV